MKIGDYIIDHLGNKGHIINVINNRAKVYLDDCYTVRGKNVEVWYSKFDFELDLERKRLEKLELLKNI